MNKIIAAFDGLKYSTSTRDYAIELAKQNKAHLVGVFLNDITHHSFHIYDLIVEKEEVNEGRIRKEKLLEGDVEKRKESANDFESRCVEAGIEFTIHQHDCIAIQELLHESIYADLLILDKKENFTFYKDTQPSHFIRDLLPHVQCPVLLVPHVHKNISQVIMLYDGEPTSVFAIKMFNYTLGSKMLPVEILTVKDPEMNRKLPDKELMKEFMKQHFKNAKYTVLKGNANERIVEHVKNSIEVPLIVLGAYRRSMVSRWFRESMADVLMKELHFPLFIAHT